MTPAGGEPVDAIVVLGAAVLPDGRPSPALARRVAHAVALFAQGAAPVLLMSGGPVGHPTPEAHVMRELASGLGVPEAAIVVEDRSRNTWENALNVCALLARHRWRRILVVSDPYHLPRALWQFRRFGAEAAGAAVPGRGADTRSRWILSHLREGLSWGKSLLLWAVRKDRRVARPAWHDAE